jgi:CBS domain-containing protein
MSSTEIPSAAGSYRSPSLERARARDAMHHGVLTCPPETSLTTVARMLAHNHVHAVVVTQPHTESDEAEHAWAVVTDVDVLRARADTDAVTAGGTASRDVVMVAPDDPLDWVAQRMVEHHASHAVVVSREADRPVGMISTLDVAGVLGWGRG